MLEELEEFSLPNELKKLERGRTFCSPAAFRNQLVSHHLTPVLDTQAVTVRNDYLPLTYQSLALG